MPTLGAAQEPEEASSTARTLTKIPGIRSMKDATVSPSLRNRKLPATGCSRARSPVVGSGWSGSPRKLVGVGVGHCEQPLHLGELPDGSLAACTLRQVPLEFPPVRRGQCPNHVARVVEAS